MYRNTGKNVSILLCIFIWWYAIRGGALIIRWKMGFLNWKEAQKMYKIFWAFLFKKLYGTTSLIEMNRWIKFR